MSKDSITIDDLRKFHGSEEFFQHRLGAMPGIIYTEGVQFLAEKGQAYWLLDVIASHQLNVSGERFQSWELKVDQKTYQAVVRCHDGNGNYKVEQVIPFTDFPIEEIELYLVNRTLMLPGEY